jgi:4-amino-4-deoxy-L-arabinose transferase-like glycosyltransferase
MSISSRFPEHFSAWLRGHFIVASLVILFCSASPRVLIAWYAYPVDLVNSYSDAGTYLSPARNLLEQGAFLNSSGEPDVHRTPGYPAFLAVIMLLVGRDMHNVLVLQAVVLSFQVLALYWLARVLMPQVTAFLGGVLASFSPWGIILAVVPMTEALFLLLLTLIFLTVNFTKALRSPAMIIVGGSCVGILTAAAVLVRPVWPLVVLISGALFLHFGPSRKKVWLLLAVTLICSLTPLAIWRERNRREAQFDGLSDIAGVTAWRYLAWRVNAQATGQDYRIRDEEWARLDKGDLKLPPQKASDEHWRRARAIFREHPFLTAYCFIVSASEHIFNPSPDILRPARLNFFGDFAVLGLLWGVLLLLACLSWPCMTGSEFNVDVIERSYLLIILVICSLLTLSSGISFGAGSRLRAPLELIVPLLASVGLLHQVHCFGGYRQCSPVSTGR